MFYKVGLRSQWSTAVEFRVIIALVVGLVATSFSPIFIRLAQVHLSPDATIFNRFWIASLALVLWNGLSGMRRQRRSRHALWQRPNWLQIVGLLFLMGSLLSTALILWAWSLNQTSVASSAIIHSIAPVFTAFWGWLFLRRQFDQNFLIGMVIAVGGTLIIGIHDIFQTGEALQGDLMTLLSTILLGAYPLVEEKLKMQLSARDIVQGSSLVGIVVVLPVVLFSGHQILPHTIKGWFSVISLASVCQIIGLGLLAYCLNRFSAEFISICHLLTPIFSAITAWVVFDEILSFDCAIGFIFVLLGIYFTLSSPSTLKQQDAVSVPLLE